jgi:hypothetical protein
MGVACKNLIGKTGGEDHPEDLHVDERIILKLILMK